MTSRTEDPREPPGALAPVADHPATGVRVEPDERPGAWWVAVQDAGGAPDVAERLFDLAQAALHARGLTLADTVRSRLHAASREGRNAASPIRFTRLGGRARCATSSYIDRRRFPAGTGLAIELLAMTGAAELKIVDEYEPPQAPCRFVAVDGHVFFSGLTSREATADVQLAEIGRRLQENRHQAAARLGAVTSPGGASCHVDRSVARDLRPELGRIVGLPAAHIRIREVDGFSLPGKLLELEVDDTLVPVAED
jgi:hypothetical protein